MSRKLVKFLIMFDNSNLLFFPGQFLTGRVILEVDEDMPVLGKEILNPIKESSSNLLLFSGIVPQQYGYLGYLWKGYEKLESILGGPSKFRPPRSRIVPRRRATVASVSKKNPHLLD